MAYIDLCWPDLFEAGTIYIFVLVCVLRGNTQRLFGSKLCCSFLIFVWVCLFLLLQFVVWLSFMRESLGVQMRCKNHNLTRIYACIIWGQDHLPLVHLDRSLRLGSSFPLSSAWIACTDRLIFSSFHFLSPRSIGFSRFFTRAEIDAAGRRRRSLCRSSFPSCRTRLAGVLVLSPPLAGVAPAGHVPRGWWVSFLFFHPAATATLPCSSRGGRSVPSTAAPCARRNHRDRWVFWREQSTPSTCQILFFVSLIKSWLVVSFLPCPTTLVTHLLLLLLLYFLQLNLLLRSFSFWMAHLLAIWISCFLKQPYLGLLLLLLCAQLLMCLCRW